MTKNKIYELNVDYFGKNKSPDGMGHCESVQAKSNVEKCGSTGTIGGPWCPNLTKPLQLNVGA